MESHIFAPMFKGIVKCPGDKGAALLSGKNDSGDELTGVEYIKLVTEMNTKKGSPQFVQDIARAHAAAILAHEVQGRGYDARLVSVEGCVHTVGKEQLSGSELMGRLWENVVPWEIMINLAPAELSNKSVCTVQEVRAILKHCLTPNEMISAVTDPYHERRVEETFKEEQAEIGRMNVATLIFTPEEAVTRHSSTLPQATRSFLADLIHAARPSEQFAKKEAGAEKWINGPLHHVSRHMERWAGFSPEIFLAERIRKRATKEIKPV